MEDLRYPIGRPTIEPTLAPEHRRELIADVGAAPALLRAAVADLDESRLDTRYRDGGWTVRQVVHHLADAHLNAFVRFKLVMTEETPTVKPWEEALWAETPDARSAPIAPSLALLEGVHARWMHLLESLAPSDFTRLAIHPTNGTISLDRMLQVYAWHGRHHVAQITALRERQGWTAPAPVGG